MYRKSWKCCYVKRGVISNQKARYVKLRVRCWRTLWINAFSHFEKHSKVQMSSVSWKIGKLACQKPEEQDRLGRQNMWQRARTEYELFKYNFFLLWNWIRINFRMTGYWKEEEVTSRVAMNLKKNADEWSFLIEKSKKCAFRGIEGTRHNTRSIDIWSKRVLEKLFVYIQIKLKLLGKVGIWGIKRKGQPGEYGQWIWLRQRQIESYYLNRTHWAKCTTLYWYQWCCVDNWCTSMKLGSYVGIHSKQQEGLGNFNLTMLHSELQSWMTEITTWECVKGVGGYHVMS